MSKVPFVDLKVQYARVKSEIKHRIDEVLEDASGFVLGKQVVELEQAFARYCEAKHCVSVGNGTDAIELALRAAGVGPGDEVLVPTNSFIATALAAHRAGATPVFVDCDPETLLMDVGDAKCKLSPRTRAMVPVHLYGQMAPMDALAAVAAAANLIIIEDAAQAHGALQNGLPPAKKGHIAATSFYPTKNLGAYGDGGAVFTDNDALADKVRRLRNYGSEVKYQHPELGFNSRLDTIQAAILLVKLQHLQGWNEARREAAERYDSLLAHVPGVRPVKTFPGNISVHHLYVIRVPNRDEVARRLAEVGVATAVHYPLPIHLQGAFQKFGGRRGEFPNAEKAADEILSLPLFPEITAAQQEQVVMDLGRALM